MRLAVTAVVACLAIGIATAQTDTGGLTCILLGRTARLCLRPQAVADRLPATHSAVSGGVHAHRTLRSEIACWVRLQAFHRHLRHTARLKAACKHT